MKFSDPKDDTQARRRFLLVSVVVALSLLGDALLYAVLPARPESFRVLVWQVGILLGANRLIRLITNELTGRWINRTNSDKPLILAVIIGSVITASYALPWGFWGLLAARLVWGACWSVLRIEGYLSALQISTDRNRGRVFAVFQAIARAGSGGGVLLGGFLCDLIGIPWTFVIYGITSLSGITLVWRVSHTSRQPVANPVKENGSATLRATQIFIWACALGITLTDQMIANLTGRIVADRICPGMPFVIGVASLSGLLLSFRTVGALAVGPAAGMLSDWLGRRRFLLIFVCTQIAVILTLAYLKHWFLIVCFLILYFFFSMSTRLGIYALAGDRAPLVGQALYMNRFATFVDLGTALGPIIGFSIYAGFDFSWVCWLSAICLLLVIGLIGGFIGRKESGPPL